MAFIPWTEIDLFHNVRRTFKELNPPGDRKVTYKAKVKLHGTNAAIQRLSDGTIECQSRTKILTPEDDNAGFARWVASVKDLWVTGLTPGQVLFGEWCGPGINKGVAVNKIPEKVFAVFAMLFLGAVGGPHIVDDPDTILDNVTAGMAPANGVHVLPWQEDLTIEIDWDAPPEELEPVLAKINALVHGVEMCDPWVKHFFGVEGLGEGLVFYPQGQGGWPEATYLRMFKAKGEKHQTINARAPATVNPEVAQSTADFVTLVLTEARLEQGATAVKPDGSPHQYDTSCIRDFLAWVARDVAKETQAELTTSGLDPKLAMRAVTDTARKWYLGKVAKS